MGAPHIEQLQDQALNTSSPFLSFCKPDQVAVLIHVHIYIYIYSSNECYQKTEGTRKGKERGKAPLYNSVYTILLE